MTSVILGIQIHQKALEEKGYNFLYDFMKEIRGYTHKFMCGRDELKFYIYSDDKDVTSTIINMAKRKEVRFSIRVPAKEKFHYDYRTRK